MPLYMDLHKLQGVTPEVLANCTSAGGPVEESNDLFGAAVQLAARACSKAVSGQIIVSGVVRDLCIGKAFRFTDQGKARLKGFDEPVRLFEVSWRGGENA